MREQRAEISRHLGESLEADTPVPRDQTESRSVSIFTQSPEPYARAARAAIVNVDGDFVHIHDDFFGRWGLDANVLMPFEDVEETDMDEVWFMTGQSLSGQKRLPGSDDFFRATLGNNWTQTFQPSSVETRRQLADELMAVGHPIAIIAQLGIHNTDSVDKAFQAGRRALAVRALQDEINLVSTRKQMSHSIRLVQQTDITILIQAAFPKRT